MIEQNTQTYLTCDGQQLKRLTHAGLNWLEKHYKRVNELNVFPVPDGDTGINMLLTMRKAYEEVANDNSSSASHIADRISYGAMMGSRGNSGTILSQIWIGFSRALANTEVFDAESMVAALRNATDMAYSGVQRPREGTILTVIREITEEAETCLEETANLVKLLEKMVRRGWKSVEKTPELLPVLKKAGVVDSGGTGLMYVLEGMLRHINGESVEALELAAAEEDFEAAINQQHEGEIERPDENIYDVQFVIKGDNLDVASIRAVIESMGDSAVIVGDQKAVKVHVHVPNPGIPLQYAANVGMLSDLVVENMLEQYYDYLANRSEQPASAHGKVGDDFGDLELKELAPGEIGVIAIAAGHGMAKIFQQLDVAGLVSGGQTNNPSTEEIFEVIESLNTDKVLILPNNSNIFLAAEQAAKMSDKEVRVIHTRSFPEGVSAMLPYHPKGDLENVAEEMLEFKNNVITAEITTATRDVEIDGVEVKQGQIIGLLDSKLKVASTDLNMVLLELLQQADLEDRELVTLYYGEEVTAADADAVIKLLSNEYPELEFEIVSGGQAHYYYILGIE